MCAYAETVTNVGWGGFDVEAKETPNCGGTDTSVLSVLMMVVVVVVVVVHI